MSAIVEIGLPASPSRVQVQVLCAALRRRLASGDVGLVVIDAGLLVSELPAVETLARVALTARRGGAAVRVRSAEPALRSLLVLVGLEEVLPEQAPDTTRANACPLAPPVRTVSGARHVLLPRRTP
jgi:hypothetical protein